MRLKKYIHCTNYQETLAFYKKIMPLGFTVEVYEPRKLVTVNFFFAIYLVLIEKHSFQPSEIFFYDVSIQKLYEHLENLLPDDQHVDRPIKNGHIRGIYEHPSGFWMSFTDPNGNFFHFEQPFKTGNLPSKKYPDFDAKEIILTNCRD